MRNIYIYIYITDFHGVIYYIKPNKYFPVTCHKETTDFTIKIHFYMLIITKYFVLE